MSSGGAVSRLYIANANKKDSGNYSCSLANVAATTISVHVLNGKYHIDVIEFHIFSNFEMSDIVDKSDCKEY